MTSSSLPTFQRPESALHVDPFEYIERLFVYFFQGYFGHECLRRTGMYYAAGEDGFPDQTTEMVITGQKPLLSEVERMPHLVVIVNNAMFAGLTLDQLQAAQLMQGQRTHADLVSGSVSFHAQAKSDVLSRRIAWQCSLAVMQLGRILLRQGGLHKIGPTPNISSASGPTAYTGPLTTEQIVSSVTTFPIFWRYAWKIQEPAAPLRRVRVDVTVKPTVPTDSVEPPNESLTQSVDESEE